MKAISLLGSFPGVTLSWNESRSLCSLFVFMCYVYGIPLWPHLPSHIQMTPWSELLAAFSPLAVASLLCWWLETATMYCFNFEHNVNSFQMWLICPLEGPRTHRAHALCEMKPLVLLSLPPNFYVLILTQSTYYHRAAWHPCCTVWSNTWCLVHIILASRGIINNHSCCAERKKEREKKHRPLGLRGSQTWVVRRKRQRRSICLGSIMRTAVW